MIDRLREIERHHVGRIVAALLAVVLAVASWTTYEPVGQYGLGAAPDNLTSEQLAAFSLTDFIYALTGHHKDTVFPTEFKAPQMARVPVYNQGSLPECVAYAAMEVMQAADLGDFGSLFTFDHSAFFASIGGGPNGAAVPDAMAKMRSGGYPVAGKGEATLHRSSTYALVQRSVSAIKAALTAYGPLQARADWPESWFRPAANGILAPPDAIVGGHSFVIYGWSDTLGGFWLRNSWGTQWGVGGNAVVPYGYATLMTMWAITDSPVKPADPRIVTPSPTVAPTATPAPTPAPTPVPTVAPTAVPTSAPTDAPTATPAPTVVPSVAAPSPVVGDSPVPSAAPSVPIATDPPVIGPPVIGPSGPAIHPTWRALGGLLLILFILGAWAVYEAKRRKP